MDIAGWNDRYRTSEPSSARLNAAPTPLLVETVAELPPGKALDLACGPGRNALWLAARGWQVTAVDGSSAAIEILLRQAAERNLSINAYVADFENHEFAIVPSAWNLIVICYYLQRDLIEPAKLGVAPGGLLLAIAHITEAGEESTAHRLLPGELANYFHGWKILHYKEGSPNDPAHKRASAEIVARRPR